MLVTKFYQVLEARRRRRALVNIRREFATAGYPLDRFRDSQIEMALTCWKDDIAAVTLSAKTIYHALQRLRVFTSGASETESTDALIFSGGIK
jgi:hypothetical protein